VRVGGGACAHSRRPIGEARVTNKWARSHSNGSKTFKFFQTLIDPNLTFLSSKKFEIKYSFEDLEKMNNFLHRNFGRDLE
jgi:hypothetical protein